MHNSVRALKIAALIILPFAQAQAAATEEQVPPCELSTLDATATANLKQFQGKVLYVDFWASWCPPCIKSFPFMNDLVHDFKDKGLEVVGINLDESVSDAEQFLAQHPTQFSVLADPSKTCAQAFGVKGMPSTYLVDHQGIIRHIHLGFRTGAKEELKENIERLLADKAQDS